MKIKFPTIDFQLIKKEGLPKDEETRNNLRKMIKFLLEAKILETNTYLTKDNLKKIEETIEEIKEKLVKLKEEYRLEGIIQKLLYEEFKAMATADGTSNVLFARYRVFVEEAENQKALREWQKDELNRVPRGLKEKYLVEVYNPRIKKSWYFLPPNWENETQKGIALVLKDILFKAKNAFKAERKANAGQEAPAPPPSPEPKPESKTLTHKPFDEALEGFKPAKKKTEETPAETEKADTQKEEAHKTDVEQKPPVEEENAESTPQKSKKKTPKKPKPKDDEKKARAKKKQTKARIQTQDAKQQIADAKIEEE